MAEFDYEKSTQQKDLEARLAAEKGEKPADLEPRTFAVEGNDLSAYVGVSPEYQTYAEDLQKPLAAEEGAEQVYEERILTALEERDENSSTASGVLGYNTISKLDKGAGEGDVLSSESESSKATAGEGKQTAEAPKNDDQKKVGGSTKVGNAGVAAKE